MKVIIKTKPIKLVFSNMMRGRSFLADSGETLDWRYADGVWLNAMHGHLSVDALVSYFGYSCEADYKDPFRFRIFLCEDEQITMEIEGKFEILPKFPPGAEFFTRTSRLDLRYFKSVCVNHDCYQLFEYDAENKKYWMSNPFETVRILPMSKLFEDIVIEKPKQLS